MENQQISPGGVLSDEQILLAEHGGVMLMAEDIRQHAYCNRIVYFRHVMGIWPVKTYKMARGERVHELKARRHDILKENDVERYHNVWLHSTRLGIGALLDAFEYTNNEIYPVEIKTGHCPEERGTSEIEYHVVQLVTQALLLEETFNMAVSRARVRYVDAGADHFIPITFDDKQRVIRQVREIRAMIQAEIIPPPTAQRGKCVDCEFWSYCMGT